MWTKVLVLVAFSCIVWQATLRGQIVVLLVVALALMVWGTVHTSPDEK